MIRKTHKYYMVSSNLVQNGKFFEVLSCAIFVYVLSHCTNDRDLYRRPTINKKSTLFKHNNVKKRTQSSQKKWYIIIIIMIIIIIINFKNLSSHEKT